jgi:hypothetical protein
MDEVLEALSKGRVLINDVEFVVVSIERQDGKHTLTLAEA